MQTTAQGFLIYQLTHSPTYLGLIGFAAGAPSWIFMLYAGVIADRVSKRKLLIITQSCMLVMATVLSILTFSGLVESWHLLILALAVGVINAFDAPARQSFILEMVDRKDLSNAIALNSTLFNLATTLGPAISGVTYAFFGPAWCFTINAFSFIAVIFALFSMKLRPRELRTRTNSTFDDLKEGLKYVIYDPSIRTLMAVAGVTSLFGLFLVTLTPAWSVSVLHGNAFTNGWLQSARGLGALIGALMLASLSQSISKGKLLTMGQFVFPFLLLVFAQIRWLPLSLVVLVGVGWGIIILYNMANTLVQILVPDELRGRVMGIYTLTFFGCMPIGHLLAGIMAEWIGAPQTITLGALASLSFATLVYVKVPTLRKL